MTDQPSALSAASRAPCRLRIMKPVPSMILAGYVAALSLVAEPPALARQLCSAAAGSSSYWSWRLIDGRKCWYEGKPMLSKSLLAWPAAKTSAARTPAKADNAAESASASPRQRGAPKHDDPKHDDPMDAEASLPDTTTFDALWRS